MSWLLSCIGCGTKNLPEKVEAKCLDFQHYSLTSVPFYIFECERFLEELYLDFNQITELPKELFHCHELQILSLSDNDLHDLPTAVSSLNNLITLDLSKNGISDIPENIKSCKRLKRVNASTNPLCRLPEGFTQLVALKELCLNDTFLEYLPANFGRLIGLEILELRENQLNTLPRSMTRLSALKRLDIGQNEFTELPEVVGHLSSLTDLWFDNNRVKRIPAEIGNLLHLAFIDASKNRLEEIDPSIGSCKHLTDLFLTDNDLEILPDSLCKCTKLTTLHVDENRLQCLPESIGALDHLIELKASHNEMSSLPASVGLMRCLQFLHVDDNLIISIPVEIGSCASLVVLTLADNDVGYLPPEMGNLAKLRVLNLCENSIKNLPVSFSKLQLAALWLSRNQAKPTVPLQCISDDIGNQKVLTCYMLPQVAQRSPSPERKEDQPLTEEELEARRARSIIHFASDEETEPQGRLSRIPTPYPKELRALAKHTKNIQAIKKNAPKNKEKTPSPVKESEQMVHAKELSSASASENVPVASITPTSSPPSMKLEAAVASESAIKATATSIVSEIVPLEADNVTITASTDRPTESSVVVRRCQIAKVSSEALQKLSPVKTNVSPLRGTESAFKGADNSFPVTDSLYETDSASHRSNLESSIRSVEKFTYKNTDLTAKSLNSDLEKRDSSSATPVSSFQTRFFQSQGIGSQPGRREESFPDKVSPQRPASVAIPNYHATPKGLNLQRPGSLALEEEQPLWHKQRPGSLAAPINTVGIPATCPAVRSSSQSALYGSHSPQKNYSSLWRREGIGDTDLVSPVLISSPISESPTLQRDSPIFYQHAVQNQHCIVEVQEAPNTDIHESDMLTGDQNNQSSAGLVSIINQVAEEALKDYENAPSQKNGELRTEEEYSRISSAFSKQGSQVPEENRTTPQGTVTYSRIPHLASSEMVMPVTSGIPCVSGISPAVAKEKPQSSVCLSGIPVPHSVASNKSKLPNPTFIPSGSSTVRRENSMEHSDSDSRSLQRKRIALISDQDISAPKNQTRTPDINSKNQTQIPEMTPKNQTRIPDITPKNQTRIPDLTTKNQTRIPDITLKTQTRIPTVTHSPEVKQTYGSPTEKDSNIPFLKHGGSGMPLPSTPVSPVDKPINQTGIPILSPSDSTTPERSSRIPTFSNSSLRGRKSGGIPTPTQKSMKYQVSPTDRGRGRAWTDRS